MLRGSRSRKQQKQKPKNNYNYDDDYNDDGSDSQTPVPVVTQFLLYSLEGCPYSEKAEFALENLKHFEKPNIYMYDIQIVKVFQENKQDWKDYLQVKTFPQIFVTIFYQVSDEDELIPSETKQLGGYKELEKMISDYQDYQASMGDDLMNP